jgi:hypothetical protein
MYRHGRYTAEAVTEQRELTTWIQTMTRLAKEVV